MQSISAAFLLASLLAVDPPPPEESFAVSTPFTGELFPDFVPDFLLLFSSSSSFGTGFHFPSFSRIARVQSISLYFRNACLNYIFRSTKIHGI